MNISKPCGLCHQSGAAILDLPENLFAVSCVHCGGLGPKRDSPELAIAAWNGPRLVPVLRRRHLDPLPVFPPVGDEHSA